MFLKNLIQKIENKVFREVFESQNFDPTNFGLKKLKSLKPKGYFEMETHAKKLIKEKSLSKSVLASYLCEHKFFQKVPTSTRNEKRSLARKEANIFIDELLENGVIFYQKVNGKKVLKC